MATSVMHVTKGVAVGVALVVTEGDDLHLQISISRAGVANLNGEAQRGMDGRLFSRLFSTVIELHMHDFARKTYPLHFRCVCCRNRRCVRCRIYRRVHHRVHPCVRRCIHPCLRHICQSVCFCSSLGPPTLVKLRPQRESGKL